jgi:hypothetical protein
MCRFLQQYGPQVDGERFVEFGDRLTNFIQFHSSKQAIVLTCRVHPGEA